MATVTPYLKWPGGKRRQAAAVGQALLDAGAKRLVDPFCGSAALFCGTEFPAYLMSDLNADAVGCHRVAVSEPNWLVNRLRFLIVGGCTREAYERIREAMNGELPGSAVRAPMFLYCNRAGFNGLVRYSRSGAFNVPWGKGTSVYLPAEEIAAFAGKAKGCNVEFAACPWEETLARVEPGDGVYLDPPCLPTPGAKETFDRFGPTSFGKADHRRLAEAARELAGRGIPVVVSGRDTSLTRDIYAGARFRSVESASGISGKAGGRKSVGELLALYGPR